MRLCDPQRQRLRSSAAFTSVASTTFTEGTHGTFTPTATGTPAPVITESGGLPTGVSFTGGALSGTPTVTGDFPISFTAANGSLYLSTFGMKYIRTNSTWILQ